MIDMHYQERYDVILPDGRIQIIRLRQRDNRISNHTRVDYSEQLRPKPVTLY